MEILGPAEMEHSVAEAIRGVSPRTMARDTRHLLSVRRSWSHSRGWHVLASLVETLNGRLI